MPESTPDQLPVPIPTCDPGSIEGVVTLSTTSTQNVKIDPTSLVKEEVIDLENLGVCRFLHDVSLCADK